VWTNGKSLAEAAFGGALSHNGGVTDLGNRVSCRKDFIPKIFSTVKGGWTKPKDMKRRLLATMGLQDLG
jgi:hypothetical protein